MNELNNPYFYLILVWVLIIFLAFYLFLRYNKEFIINKVYSLLKIKKKEIEEGIKEELKKVIVYFSLGLLVNKLLTLIPIVNEILNYLIVNHEIIKISLLNVINAILVFLILNSFVNILIYLIYNYLDEELIKRANLDDLIKYLGVIINITISLVFLGLNLALLIPIAGALGIGIGFALQDFLKNLIAGLVILFSKLIKKGDYIKIGNLEGYVKEINLRSTIIRTLTNEEIIIPNSLITQGALINYSLSDPLIKISVPFGVSYFSDIDKVLRIAKEVSSKYSKGEPRVFIKEYGQSSINFEIWVWVDITKESLLEIKSKIYHDLFKEFKKEGIEIPFTQMDIWFKNELRIKQEK
jgi:small-conductance mechanosensitive channel